MTESSMTTAMAFITTLAAKEGRTIEELVKDPATPAKLEDMVPESARVRRSRYYHTLVRRLSSSTGTMLAIRFWLYQCL